MRVWRRETYGYVIVASAFVVYLLVAGTYYGLSVLIPVMAADLGWSATAFGAAFSIFALLLGVSAPLVGAFIVRFGARVAILTGSLLAATALALMSITSAVWQLYAFVILLGWGFGLGTMLPMQQLIGNWFVSRRSLFLGLVLSGAGLGGLVIAPLTSGLTSVLGSWRPVWLVLASLLLLPALLALFVIRDRPEDLGQRAEGVTQESGLKTGAPASEKTHRVYRSSHLWETKAAIRTRAFWLIALACGIMFFLLQAITAHQVAYLVDEAQVDLTVAASALGLIAGSSIVGRLVSGWLGDRVEPRVVTTGLLLMMSFSLIVLLIGNGLVSVYVYVVLFGMGYGGIIVLIPAIVLNYYGSRNSAAIMGIGMLLQTILGALGAIVVGGIKDTYSTYLPAFWLMIGLGLAGALCALAARPPAPEEVDAPDRGVGSTI